MSHSSLLWAGDSVINFFSLFSRQVARHGLRGRSGRKKNPGRGPSGPGGRQPLNTHRQGVDEVHLFREAALAQKAASLGGFFLEGNCCEACGACTSVSHLCLQSSGAVCTVRRALVPQIEAGTESGPQTGQCGQPEEGGRGQDCREAPASPALSVHSRPV